MAKKVFIGVGHGGYDPGAVANEFKEKDINLDIALACNNELVRHGISTLMSRTKDENDTLDEEIKECNTFNPDLAIDIHNNAGGGDGVEAFYHYGGGLSKTMADNVLAEIVKIGQNSRGAKTRLWNGNDYYGFIRETKAPAVIVECAFLDNANDVKIVDTLAERKTMGVAIAKGILKTLGIAYKSETTSQPAAAVISGYNIFRNTDYLVIFAGKVSTGTNIWGTEVAFNSQGIATSDPVSGVGNMKIPSDGFVLSGHGINSTWIKNNIKKGSRLIINTQHK